MGWEGQSAGRYKMQIGSRNRTFRIPKNIRFYTISFISKLVGKITKISPQNLLSGSKEKIIL